MNNNNNIDKYNFKTNIYFFIINDNNMYVIL